jgi:hypothetical protein
VLNLIILAKALSYSLVPVLLSTQYFNQRFYARSEWVVSQMSIMILLQLTPFNWSCLFRFMRKNCSQTSTLCWFYARKVKLTQGELLSCEIVDMTLRFWEQEKNTEIKNTYRFLELAGETMPWFLVPGNHISFINEIAKGLFKLSSSKAFSRYSKSVSEGPFLVGRSLNTSLMWNMRKYVPFHISR